MTKKDILKAINNSNDPEELHAMGNLMPLLVDSPLDEGKLYQLCNIKELYLRGLLKHPLTLAIQVGKLINL